MLKKVLLIDPDTEYRLSFINSINMLLKEEQEIELHYGDSLTHGRALYMQFNHDVVLFNSDIIPEEVDSFFRITKKDKEKTIVYGTREARLRQASNKGFYNLFLKEDLSEATVHQNPLLKKVLCLLR